MTDTAPRRRPCAKKTGSNWPCLHPSPCWQAQSSACPMSWRHLESCRSKGRGLTAARSRSPSKSINATRSPSKSRTDANRSGAEQPGCPRPVPRMGDAPIAVARSHEMSVNKTPIIAEGGIREPLIVLVKNHQTTFSTSVSTARVKLGWHPAFCQGASPQLGSKPH